MVYVCVCVCVCKERRFRDFHTADDIRETLQQDHSIVIDDGAREWRVRMCVRVCGCMYDIRETLQQDHSIVIDDGAREWRVCVCVCVCACMT
jgi:hypothetical protein